MVLHVFAMQLFACNIAPSKIQIKLMTDYLMYEKFWGHQTFLSPNYCFCRSETCRAILKPEVEI